MRGCWIPLETFSQGASGKCWMALADTSFSAKIFFFFEARLNGGIWKLGSSASAWIICLKGDRDLGDTALTKGQLKGSEVPASLLILEK